MTGYMNHEAGRKALLEIADILDSLSIPFFLIQGTALGAYRDGGFVPTERDIDIGVLQEYLAPKFGDIAKILCDRGYEIESWSKPFVECRTLVVRLHGCKVDIVGMLEFAGKRFTACPVHSSIKKPYAIVHDAAMLETYNAVKLFGRRFFVPAPIDQYLALEYGPEWRTPKEDHISRTRIYNFVDNCGLANPATMLTVNDSPEKLQELYAKDYYDYLRSPEFAEAFMRPIGEIVDQFGQPCLDVACGEGQLSPFVEGQYFGFDGSDVAIENARKMHPGRQFAVGRFERPADIDALAGKQFGTIVFGSILEVLIRKESQLAFMEHYRRQFNAQHFIIYDLLRLDTSAIDQSPRYRKLKEFEATADHAGIPDVKKHRKILVYECV